MPEQPNEKLYPSSAIDPPTEVAPSRLAYAELDVTSNFSFLRGASHPDELVYTAAMLGYRALAITDINSLAGVVRAYEAARKVKGFRLLIGARLVFADGTPDLLVWPKDRAAYGRLCRLLTLGKRRAEKAKCHLTIDDLAAHQEGFICAAAPFSGRPEGARLRHGNEECPFGATAKRISNHAEVSLAYFRALREILGDRLSLAANLDYGGDNASRLAAMLQISRLTGIPLVATNHVHYHDPGRRQLQDVLSCVRHGCTIHEAGYRLFANGERYLKSPGQMHRLFAACPQAIGRGLEIVRQCTFDLGELKYDYPNEVVPPGSSPSQHLRELTYAGAAERYPQGIPESVVALLEKELTFICGSKYEAYFLTVHDVVRYARSRGILCQGRGSAANSAVCYCLGVTSVDPTRFQLVFERFASSARAEPPDIDIDFEHERREEVIQYVYQKYGRERAGMTGGIITYRGRSAIRDVGKALGLGLDMVGELAGKLDWWHRGTLSPTHLKEISLNPADRTLHQLLNLSSQLLGFPRHLSQHVGGMIICNGPLCELVPIENAAMEDRTVIEWDKDDIDALGIFKVDLLALGMLTALSKGLKMISARQPGEPVELHTIPPEEKCVYEMICDADTVGVFQIESRAQMSMLPRMKPVRFYDLVIEVAIVRPGPIQGDMVHPYLKRRCGEEAVEYPKEELREVLEKTLGVPLFQEQAMRLAIVAAGFTGAEADQLRKAMAAWKRHGGLNAFYDKFINGMVARGYEPDFAERCFRQISGFGEYGFPESHAASFALLVYASAWLKRHHPAAFAAALLNSQPMGFYAPAQIVRDAKEHGVDVRPADVNASAWDCTLEEGAASPNVENLHAGSEVLRRAGSFGARSGSSEYLRTGVGDQSKHSTADKHTWGLAGPALRLGFRQLKGMRQDAADRIALVRQRHGRFTSIEQFHHLTGLSPAAIRHLSEADAFASLGCSRRQAAWRAMALSSASMPLFDAVADDNPPPPVTLPHMPLSQEVITDYSTAGLSLKRHPVSFARSALSQRKVIPAAMLADERGCPHGRWVKVAGLVLVRQRPGTASGVVFITLEDETGIANLILWSTIYEANRAVARHATFLQADGYVQREGQVVHVLTKRMFDLSHLLHGMSQPSRDFH